MNRLNLCRGLAFVIGLCFFYPKLNAQSPNAIPYQAVARNSAGNLLQNQPVRVRFSLHEGTASGAVVYQETHTATTNNLGLFSVNIGQGTPISGTFAGINWGGGLKFTQVELDPSGGTAYLDMGTVQMLSVPYAFYAAMSGNAVNESDPQVSSTTANAVPKWNGSTLADGTIHDDGTNVGIGTHAPAQKLDVVGTIKTVGFQMPTGATENYVLVTNAAGNASWMAPSSVFSDTDDQTLSLSGTMLSIDGGNAVNLSGVNTDAQTLSLSGTTLNISGGNGVNLSSIDTDTDDQTLSLSGTTLSIDGGNAVNLASINTDAQTLSLSGTTLNISGGNGVNLSSIDTDTDDQTLSLSGTTLSIDGGNGVNLSSIDTDTDDQTLLLSGTMLSIDGGNTVNLSGVNTDAQTLSLSGTTLNISGGNGVNLSSIDTDTDDQTLSLSGTTLAISQGNSVSLSSVNTDAQTLSLSGTTLAITGGNSVNLSSLSTDTDDQTLSLSGTTLSIAGGNSVDIVQKQLKDADGDTKIQVEETSDEDKIRFDLSGTERWVMSGTNLEPTNAGGSVFIGKNVGVSDDLTNNYNVGIGDEALKSNSTGSGNVAVGNGSMYTNTTGVENTAVGDFSLPFSTTSNSNVAVGAYAGYKNTTGYNNTFLGRGAGNDITTGYDNIFIGYNAGDGYDADAFSRLVISPIVEDYPLVTGWFFNNEFDIYGYMGIGTTPGNAALDIDKYLFYGDDGDAFCFYNKCNQGNSSTDWNDQFSFFCTQRAGAAEFDAFSDRRIKNVIGQSDAAMDLETLKQIKITDYTMKDTLRQGTKVHKKVIAQELETVFPLAVGTMTNEIPDIYKSAKIKDGYVVLPNSGLKRGERVLLTCGYSKAVYEVDSVDVHGFSVCDNPELKKLERQNGGNIFVYGREVDDFHLVDYDALTTLNISATQELARQVEVLKGQNALLTQTLEKEQNANAAALAQLRAELAAFKAAVLQGGGVTNE